MKSLKIGVAILIGITMLCPLQAQATYQIFFGEDEGAGEATPLTAWANAEAARDAFLGNLVGAGIENFEGFSDGTGANLAITFPTQGTATLGGNGEVNTVSSGTTNGYGRYATSGTNYWESSQVFNITFSQGISAFGFYGIDIGDFAGQLTLHLTNGNTYDETIPTQYHAGGGVIFWGIIDTEHEYDYIQFGNTNQLIDVFGFDDMIVGEQGNIVPEPSTLILLGLGLVGGTCLRLRNRKKA